MHENENEAEINVIIAIITMNAQRGNKHSAIYGPPSSHIVTHTYMQLRTSIETIVTGAPRDATAECDCPKRQVVDRCACAGMEASGPRYACRRRTACCVEVDFPCYLATGTFCFGKTTTASLPAPIIVAQNDGDVICSQNIDDCIIHGMREQRQ